MTPINPNHRKNMILLRASRRTHLPIYPHGHEAGGYPENSRGERTARGRKVWPGD